MKKDDNPSKLGALYGMALEGNRNFVAKALDQLILDLEGCSGSSRAIVEFHPDQIDFLVKGLKGCREEIQAGKSNPFGVNPKAKYDKWGFPHGRGEKMEMAYRAVERLKQKNPSMSNEDAIAEAPGWLLKQEMIEMPVDTVHKYYYQYKKALTDSD